MGRRSAVVAALAVSACATGAATPPAAAPSGPLVERAGAPATALQYTTAARPAGVSGGPDAAALANKVREALRARGDEGEPDGALAAAAAWLVAQNPDARFSTQQIALRGGFPGMTSTTVAFWVNGEDRDAWRQSLTRIARNEPINRFGVYVSPDGIAMVIFGRMEVSLDPLPRRFRPGDACRLRGEVAARYDRVEVFLYGPDGKIDEKHIPGRKIDLSLPLQSPGVYRLEMMSTGIDGPVVLANVPIYVGVEEPALAPLHVSNDVKVANPAEAEARILTLLNEARREARVPELAGDSEVRAVALAHTADMIAGHFFGHASPTTGRVDNRLRRAGVRVSLFGENVVQADAAESAHRTLMESPGHRANMLFPKFTHVGIGVAAHPTDTGDLVATLVFVRRPRPPASVTPALVADFISSLRRAKGLAPISIDPVLQHAAAVGGATLPSEGAAASEAAVTAAYAAVVDESKRLRIAHPAVCGELTKVLELDDLERDSIVLQPGPLKLGLATATKRADDTLTIFILVLAAGATCR